MEKKEEEENLRDCWSCWVMLGCWMLGIAYLGRLSVTQNQCMRFAIHFFLRSLTWSHLISSLVFFLYTLLLLIQKKKVALFLFIIHLIFIPRDRHSRKQFYIYGKVLIVPKAFPDMQLKSNPNRNCSSGWYIVRCAMSGDQKSSGYLLSGDDPISLIAYQFRMFVKFQLTNQTRMKMDGKQRRVRRRT